MVCRAALLLVSLAGGLCAQATLALSTAVAAPGAPAVLTLSLGSGGASPAGLQWRLAYDPSTLPSLDVRPAQAAISSGKSLECAQSSGSVTCVLVLGNRGSIPSGVLAQILATPASSSAPIALVDTAAVTGDGGTVPVAVQNGGFVAAAGGSATGTPGSSASAQLNLTSMSCSPAVLYPGQYANCEVNVSDPPDQSVTLSVQSADRGLEVPSSVLLLAGSTNTSLLVHALSPPITSLARLTVALSPGSSLTATVTVNAGVRLGR